MKKLNTTLETMQIFFFNIIISAHGNSIRSLLKYLFKIDDNEISKLEIPTGNPLLLKFEKKNIKEAKYLDQSRSRDLIKF